MKPLFKQLNIMKVADSFKLQCLKFYHKFKIKSLPAFFDNIFMRNSDIHPYGTRRRDQLHFFSYKTAGASKCLRHFIPNLLNDIDPDTRRKLDTLSLDGFGSYYKSLVIFFLVWDSLLSHSIQLYIIHITIQVRNKVKVNQCWHYCLCTQST